MRGERATLGKSLLDVQRELRIKASYIAAIENCDPTAFDTPGFIAGYVRSYARYLGMDPDDTYAVFCAESGFETAHGMSDAASSRKQIDVKASKGPVANRDPFSQPALPFAPSSDSILSRVEPGAIGSTLVLVLLLGGLGYGGFSVLKEVQRVQLAPVDQTPVVLSDLDPLQTTLQPTQEGDATEDTLADATGAGVFTPPATTEAFDRLYRPQALDVPVLVARDAPISTLDPNSVGAFAQIAGQSLPSVDLEPAESFAGTQLASSGALPEDGITLIAARPAWVRVRGNDRSILFERVMAAGDTWTVPASEADALLNVGESGALYVAVNGRTVGPVGPAGTVTSDLPLDGPTLVAALEPAVLQNDGDLNRVLADMGTQVTQPSIGQPKILEDTAPGVMLVAVRPAWIRVRAADGSVIYETIMNAGDTYQVPATEQPPTLRVGESGAIYFAMNGQTYGPAGPRGSVTSDLALSVDALSQQYSVASIEADSDLARVVAELAVPQISE
ncbi:helix-turn-helix domain-containing protein [Marivita sp. S6314]|uniref:helix-turn-helix domain-containing protein n=1 Tax=Marivita sp. S6314 TaxID=2926406 RepID=UPI001FF15691|nr:helix-turn-helix domain-containing protein [Marivita sp. S6314]MCK0148690.1 helix-turn-helix domain-containing protein [Marivita sp. S6314]